MLFGEATFDFAVSVMTLHHLLPDRKVRLYARIRKTLKSGSRYIEGDYMVSQEKEIQLMADYRGKLGPQGAFAEGAYHMDFPFAIETQRELLLRAGFCQVGVIWKEADALVLVAEA